MPDAPVIAQRAIPQRAEHEFSEEQDIALGAHRQERHGGGVHASAQREGDDLFDRLGREARNLQSLDETVFPQGNDRVRGGLGYPDRHEDGRGVRRSQLEDQGGGGVVEEVGIVHEHHQPTPGGPFHECGHRAPEEIGPVVGHPQVTMVDRRKQRRERPEGEIGRRPCRSHSSGGEASSFCPVQALEREARLAHAGRASQDHPATVRVRDELEETAKLPRPADDRPVPLHDSSLAPSVALVPGY
jgi:hypothetical protein